MKPMLTGILDTDDIKASTAMFSGHRSALVKLIN